MNRNYRCVSAFLFVSIVLCSCSNIAQKDSETIQALTIVDTLQTSQVISLNEDIKLHNPLRILNVDDRYLIIGKRTPNDFFEVFKLPELDHLFSWGKQGRGPNEFSNPPVYLNVSNDQFIAYEDLSQRLRIYHVTDTSLEESRSLSLSYDGQLDPLNRIQFINDSLYFADYGSSTEDTNYEHIALRPDEKEPLFTFGNYPETDLEGYDRYAEFRKENMANPKGSRFVASYFNHDMFKIYDVTGKELKKIQINDSSISEQTNNSTDEFLYRSSGWASNKYIYFLGIYGPSEKIYDKPDSSFYTSMEIWSWEGKPKYRASFDRPIHNFTVSEKHKKLYGFSSLAPGEVYEYDLSKILNSIE